jgi:hypothetical protein
MRRIFLRSVRFGIPGGIQKYLPRRKRHWPSTQRKKT